MYANITNPANFQLQDFAQFGFRVITTDFIPVPGEQYRTLYVLQDAVVTATTQKGDDITSKAILAGTLLHGLFNSVSITSGRVLAYAAGRVTAEEIIALYEAYVIALGGTLENAQCAVDTINEDGVDFFADASLVMIPEGYATGVVYGQRPLTSDSQLTFTRASTATRVGPDGAIEKARTNLFLQSSNFANASWSKTAIGTGIAPVVSTDFGTINGLPADKVTFDPNGATSSDRSILQQSVAVSSNPHTQSWLIQSLSGTQQIRIEIVGVSSTNYTITETPILITNTQSLTAGTIDFRIQQRGDITRTNGEFLIAYAQLETGDIATDYIPTTTTAVSVGILSNVPRIDYTGGGCGKLLLEPQRTNLALFSEQFDNAAWTKFNVSVSANQATSPDGYLNADKLIPNTVATSHQINIAVTGAAHTMSIFAKAGEYSTLALFYTVHDGRAVFNLSNGTITETTGTVTSKIEDYGNGWYRCILSTTLTTHNNIRIYAINGTTWADVSTAGDGTSGIFIYGAQLEVGSYATSYIPTLGSSVTRLADACSKTGISNLIGQTQGTIFVEVNDAENTGTADRVVAIGDGTSANRIVVIKNSTGNIFFFVASGGSTIINQTNIAGTSIVNGNFKIAVAYKSGEYAIYRNGALVFTSTAAVVPATSNYYLAVNEEGGVSAFSGKFSQALLFKTRLTNEQLQKLTSL